MLRLTDELGPISTSKSERAVVDFEDVLVYMCGILQERPDIARLVRGQYRNFVVDEFQPLSTSKSERSGVRSELAPSVLTV